MASIITPPNPSLIGILLVTQSRNGSDRAIPFHYPPNPLRPSESETRQNTRITDSYEDSSSSSDSESTSEDETPTPRRVGLNSQVRQSHDTWSSLEDEEGHISRTRHEVRQNDKSWQPSWEPLLGLGTDALSGVLRPDRTWHKRRFEVGVNDFCFLGWPVFARSDGTWRKQRTRKTYEEEKPERPSESEADGDALEDEADTHEQDADEVLKLKTGLEKSELTMFNIVFVLDPPILENDLRVQEMYDNIAKKFTRALKWEQGRSEYVWKESELISSITSKHFSQQSPTSVLYTELLSKSSLAAAISTVFTNISSSKIASVNLSPSVSISLQIPPATSTSVMPCLTDPPNQPGLWLTTANEPLSSPEDDTALSSVDMAKHFTLLLKSSKARILKDVQSAGGPLAKPLTNFITALTPTKSFYKISASSGIPLSDIQPLARHLIYWRRAVAVPPLNQRDTYIVSPNADMSKLKAATKTYEAAFPTLPSLPKMLALLSDTPKPWGFLIPSTDHKEAYYEVLAWLLRGGWVTQLRTTAFVCISPEIKQVVREKDATEAMVKVNLKDQEPSKTSTEDNASEDDNEDDTSPAHRPTLHSRPSSDAKSTTLTSHTTSSSNLNIPSHALKPDDPRLSSLVINPNKAAPLEAAWLDALFTSVTTSTLTGLTDLDRDELKKYWPVFIKYFNGNEALENIPVREGLKRKVVWEMLGKMGLDFDSGVEKVEGRSGWLVTVRHW